MSRRSVPSLPRAGVLALLVSVVIVVALAGLLLPLDRWVPAAREQLLPSSREESSCTMELTTTLTSTLDRICDPVNVTTTFSTACPVCPEGLNVVFIQDDTPYPEWQKQVSLQALDEFFRYSRKGVPVSVAVLHYNGQGVRVALRPTLNVNAARGPLTSFRVAHDPRALFMEAAQQGVATLRQARQLRGGSYTPACEFVIYFVYTKVYMADKGQEMIQAGRTILRAVPNLYVGCPHQHPEECTIWEPQVPKSIRYYTEDPEPGKLRGMVVQGLRDIEDRGAVRMVSLTTDQWLPKGLGLVPGSFNIEPERIEPDAEQTRMQWKWRLSESTDEVTVTFRAKPVDPGAFTSGVAGEWRDSANRLGKKEVVSEPITVIDDPCFTPTPTVPTVVVPTFTETPVPTATATDVPTRTPVPTATPRPKPIYLPLALSEECVPEEKHADVVLVIDVSTSMRRESRTGRTKLEATQDAAKAFVSFMDLQPDALGRHDQVAIVGFNRTAWIQAPLGADAAVISQAIDDLTNKMAELTRLDLALQRGAEAILQGARRNENTPVLVLLTDGLPNQVPPAEDGSVETTVLRAASAAKQAGIIVYTVAIGAPEDTNPKLLIGCASTPDRYYYTPDPEDLEGIYRAIAHSIDCPPGAFWGGR